MRDIAAKVTLASLQAVLWSKILQKVQTDSGKCFIWPQAFRVFIHGGVALTPTQGSFCVEFARSLCVCVQKHARVTSACQLSGSIDGWMPPCRHPLIARRHRNSK